MSEEWHVVLDFLFDQLLSFFQLVCSPSFCLECLSLTRLLSQLSNKSIVTLLNSSDRTRNHTTEPDCDHFLGEEWLDGQPLDHCAMTTISEDRLCTWGRVDRVDS